MKSLTILFALLSSCLLLAQDSPPPTYTDATAYELYNTILNQPCPKSERNGMQWENWGCDLERANPLLIVQETRPGHDCSAIKLPSDEAITAAFRDWQKQNQTTRTFSDNFSTSVAHKFISAEEISTRFSARLKPGETPKRDRWDEFYEAHPGSGGWVELSAIGFNEDRTVAVVFISHYCGRLCGRGFLQAYRMQDGVWRPVKWALTGRGWMS